MLYSDLLPTSYKRYRRSHARKTERISRTNLHPPNMGRRRRKGTGRDGTGRDGHIATHVYPRPIKPNSTLYGRNRAIDLYPRTILFNQTLCLYTLYLQLTLPIWSRSSYIANTLSTSHFQSQTYRQKAIAYYISRQSIQVCLVWGV